MKKRQSKRTGLVVEPSRMALCVAVVGLLIATAQVNLAQDGDSGVKLATALSLPSHSTIEPAPALSRTDSVRTLAEYYARRSFPGAPPMIPHVVTNDASYGARTCNRCHTRNRYVPRFDAYTPVTPHPEMLSCRSCHVPIATTDLFRETDWVTPDPLVLAGGVLDGSPPAIPHSLQLRENCAACHTGPGSVPEIRSNHPERVDCQQCHVASTQEGVWIR